MGNINELMGDAIDDLVGDAAKSLMAQAEAMESPAMKERAKRVARSVSAQARDELISAARNANFSRESDWMGWLGLTHREQKVLGRVYSFQCTKNKDGYSSAPAPQQAPVLLAVDLYDEDIPF